MENITEKFLKSNLNRPFVRLFFLHIRKRKKVLILSNDKKICRWTFQEYDDLLQELNNVSIRPYWPKEEDFALFEKNPEEWLTLLIYMAEIVPTTCKKEEYAWSRINAFLREHLILEEE